MNMCIINAVLILLLLNYHAMGFPMMQNDSQIEKLNIDADNKSITETDIQVETGTKRVKRFGIAAIAPIMGGLAKASGVITAGASVPSSAAVVATVGTSKLLKVGAAVGAGAIAGTFIGTHGGTAAKVGSGIAAGAAIVGGVVAAPFIAAPAMIGIIGGSSFLTSLVLANRGRSETNEEEEEQQMCPNQFFEQKHLFVSPTFDRNPEVYAQQVHTLRIVNGFDDSSTINTIFITISPMTYDLISVNGQNRCAFQRPAAKFICTNGINGWTCRFVNYAIANHSPVDPGHYFSGEDVPQNPGYATGA